MNVPQLNDDCIYYIIKSLQNSHSTLFNFLLVGRFWCKVAIPLLYTNPFSKLKDESKILIIKTFLLCLNEKEKIYLTKQNNIYGKTLNLNLFRNNVLKPIFEYSKYIKQLSKNEVYEAVDHWYKQEKINKTIPSCREMSFSIKATLYHMFLRQSNYIKDLGFYSNLFCHDIFDIHFINSFIFNISNLITLHLEIYDNSENSLEFLRLFAKKCKNLNQLSLSYEQCIPSHHLNEIISIIEQQCELKEFRLYGAKQLLINNIFTSLEFQKDSLVSLKIKSITFQKFILQCIIKFHNLKSFEIDSFYGITLELCKIFEFASFKLKKLSIKNRYCEDNIITPQIIRCLGMSLQILKFKYMNINIMETISLYCLDLETLDIDYSSTDLLTLSYLKNLKIKNLNIHFNIHTDEDALFLITLAKNLSETITNVSLIYTWKIINKNDLLNFLNNCHNYIITLNFDWNFDLGHLKVILNYIKKNNSNLKYLGIYNLDKIWNTKELDLLNQIKERGVKLVKFINNYKDDYTIFY